MFFRLLIAESFLDGEQSSRRLVGNPIFPECNHALLTSVERPVYHARHLRVQRQGPLAHSREYCLEPCRQRLHCIEVYGSSRAFQTVRTAKGLIEIGTFLDAASVFEQREDGADMLQMFSVLALKNGREFLANVG